MRSKHCPTTPRCWRDNQPPWSEKHNGRNKAASDLQETVSLIWKDTSGKRLTGLTHVAGAGEQQGHRVSVAAVPLDSYISNDNVAGKRVAFIKCDVEGYECQVIVGARRLIAQWHPLISPRQKRLVPTIWKTSTNLFEILILTAIREVYSALMARCRKSRQQAIQDPAIFVSSDVLSNLSKYNYSIHNRPAHSDWFGACAGRKSLASRGRGAALSVKRICIIDPMLTRYNLPVFLNYPNIAESIDFFAFVRKIRFRVAAPHGSAKFAVH